MSLLGQMSYWTGCGLAAAFAAAAVLHVAVGGTHPVETMMLAAGGALLAWLTGRGLRFALATQPRDVAP